MENKAEEQKKKVKNPFFNRISMIDKLYEEEEPKRESKPEHDKHRTGHSQ
jgi:hypothetical protein